jgi:16S rRNA (uracil1498-N3)-methyltransferase
MKRYFVDKKNIDEKNNLLIIDGEEFNHAKNVMRQDIGDEIICFTGDGFEYFCQINKNENHSFVCIIKSKQKSLQTPLEDVTLFQGTLKSDNFELIIQKTAELGISTIVPFESRYSVAKIKDEKIKRYQKISQSASKQCGRADFLKVEDRHSFKQMLNKLKEFEVVIFAYEKAESKNLKTLNFNDFKGKKTALVVGSEGGFSKEEADLLIQNNAICVGLGTRILRAETAAITLASIVMFLLDEI